MRPQRGVLPLAALVLALALLALARPAPASSSRPTNAPPAAGLGLTAIDVSADALPLLDSLGIPYQDQPRAGLIRAAASAAQRAALDRAHVAYTAIARVAIQEQGQPRLAAAQCSAENTNDYTIADYDPYEIWTYAPVFTNCYPDGTVAWVDIHFVFDHVYAGAAPPGGPGLYELAVNLGTNQPSWRYVNVESYDLCAISSEPKLAALVTYDRWIWDVDATMGTHVFTGRPANQRWDLASTHYCPNSPTPILTYWGIWVYYNPYPTATPTMTRSNTPRASATPSQIPSSTPTPRGSATLTATPRVTKTDTPWATHTPTRTPTPGPSLTVPPPPVSTATRTPEPTWTPAPGSRARAYLPLGLKGEDRLDGCTDLLFNGGFETGALAPWGTDSAAGLGPGRWSAHGAWLGGQNNSQSEVFRFVNLPTAASQIVWAFWWRAEAASAQAGDRLLIRLEYGGGEPILAQYPATAPLDVWRYGQVDLTPYAGQRVMIGYLATTDGSVATTFRVDDVRVRACGP